MPVASPSPDYVKMQTRWQKARDCIEGSHAVKAAGSKYLPLLAGHEAGGYHGTQTGGESIRWPRQQDDYTRYKERALYYNASGRTVDGLVGMVFRRPPVVETPAGADDILSDVDMLGRNLEAFAKALLREVLTPGRVGVLVEHTTQGAPELRPYFRMYMAEDILDVIETVMGGAVVPAQIRLHETFEEPGDEEWESTQIDQVRVLEMVQGIYRQRVFRREEGGEYVLVEEVVPTVDGRPLESIPFWTFSADEGGRPGTIEPPPLLDLCEVNLCHYRQDADLRNALHMAGVPTFCVSGMEAPSAGAIKVGTAEVLFLPPADAKAYFVSYGAEGAAAIENALDKLEQMMAFLGARMLQPEKRGIEAAETAQIHRQGEISVLGAIANGINAKLTFALQMLLRWGLFGGVETAKIELNSDFVPAQANPQLLAQMMAAWQAGAISHDSLWHFAQTGELVDPRRTAEEERALIEEEKPEEEAEAEQLGLEGQRIGIEQQRVMMERMAAGEEPAPEQQAAE